MGSIQGRGGKHTMADQRERTRCCILRQEEAPPAEVNTVLEVDR